MFYQEQNLRYFPDMNISVHVLTYGFTRSQEVILERNRSNGYVF